MSAPKPLPEPVPDCYYCAGTGLAGDGWHDCPVCLGDMDESDHNEDWYGDDDSDDESVL